MTRADKLQFRIDIDVRDDSELHCPFPILEEFEQWWEWHYRVYHMQENQNAVSWKMLGIIDSSIARVRNELEIMLGRIP